MATPMRQVKKKEGFSGQYCMLFTLGLYQDNVKVDYHSNENPLKISEKNSICWSKVIVSNNNNKKEHLPMLVFKTNAIKFLGVYIKNSF